jgi:tRNA/rRNA methyltransferase
MKPIQKPYHLTVVLVGSLYDSNVGASSRAMANMGFDRLVLVRPECEITYAAHQAAATGQNALRNHKSYQTWKSFYAEEPEGIRISLTAKDGRGRAVQDLSKTLEWIQFNEPRFQDPDLDSVPIYLIFGPENWGLSTEDLELTHFCCSIPTFGENASLNLAQAVLLTLFILRDTWGGTRTTLEGAERTRLTSRSNTSATSSVFPEQTLKNWLLEMGYDLSKPKINAYTTLRRMMLHNVPTPKELIALETALQQSIRKMKK